MGFLDPSNPEQAHAAERLQREIVVWLATVSKTGQPQSSPEWFLQDGDSFLIYSQPMTIGPDKNIWYTEFQAG